MIGAIAGAIAACVYNIPKWIVTECNKILSPKLLEYLTEFEVFIMKKISYSNMI